MSMDRQEQFRKIPSVEAVLADPRVQNFADQLSRSILRNAARNATDQARAGLQAGVISEADHESLRQLVVEGAVRELRTALQPQYQKVINASGIILHTGLGRAVLPAAALKHILDDLSGYSLLQMDRDTGRRGSRDARIQWLLQQLTGAEAATVVNNNAAATSLVLNTIAQGKEVIVSRGQLVEIGGSFRLPEVMAASGAALVEVGTTNKTHLRDYERAITENTAAIMRVHPSNYKISGFTSEVPLKALVELAHCRDLLLYDDLGAGPLIDVSRFGFHPEPTLNDSIAAGADLVSCSADKLIGGPQGGIILGRSEWVKAVRKNPIARIVRAGKLTLAALEATLPLFLDQERAVQEVPTLNMLARTKTDISEQAERIANALKEQQVPADVTLGKGYSQMGSGSLPTQNLPTRLVVVNPHEMAPHELSHRLRLSSPAVFTRLKKERILIDPRTLRSGEETTLIEAFVQILTR
ncbi:MAG: L-seryl-tRNA(Sec) selenium transferase [Planctomycetota bacterium]